MQQRRLDAPDVVVQVAVARRLPGLLLQRLQLAFERDDDVVQARQVGLGRAQPQLRLVPARMQAGDARSLLEQGTAIRRLGVDEGTDAALADQCRRVRAGRGVREQQLHVARAHVVAVDAVAGAAAALDAAADLQLVMLVELGRDLAVEILKRQHDLGDVARRPRGAAAEDNVLHLAAAHRLGRSLAHGPAQRLDEVRLAAAVGPDDPGKTGIDEQFGGIDE